MPPTRVEEQWVTENVLRYWLYDKRVVVYEPQGFDRQTTDEWYNTVSETLANWDKDKPMIAVHDMRKATLTPYTRHRASQLTKENKHLHGHSIIVIPDTLIGNFMKIFLNTVLSRVQPNIQRHMFFTMEDVYSLLDQMLEQEIKQA